MVTQRMKENANKFAYLVKAYPEKNVNDIINLFRLAPVDVNSAIWLATELNWIKIDHRKETVELPDPKKKNATISQEVTIPYAEVTGGPEVWDFGSDVKELEDTLQYAFEHINKDENDMEENYLSSWLQGYAPQDSLIAVKHLMEDGVLHEYQLEDGENKYIFYTLKKNADKLWGQKQFKKNPLSGEDNEAESKPEEAEAEKAEE